MNWLRALCAGVMLWSAGCWMFTHNPVVPAVPDGGFADATPGTTFVDCSDAALHQAALTILPDIETDLALSTPAAATAAIEAFVATLAVQVGGPLALAEAACAVQWAIAEATAHFDVTADSLDARKAGNGKAWLASHPGLTVANAGAL